MIAQQFKIQGRVQGVGFRYFVLQQAEKLGIKGNVKNMNDGSVLVNAEGSDQNMTLFYEQCAQGPYWSKVSSILIEDIPIHGYQDFQIIR